MTLLIIAKFGLAQLIYDISVFQKNILRQNTVNSNFSFGASKIDSLFFNKKNLETGEYIIYNDTIDTIPIFRLFIKDGNIDGVYCYFKNGFLSEIGSYKNDSLWTFKKGTEDTTFMIGAWSRYGRFKGFGDYYWEHISTTYYKIPYDESGNYIEKWYHYGGKLWQYREYKKEYGLVVKKIFDYQGNTISTFEKFKNASVTKMFNNNGVLESISIDDKMSYWITLQKGEEFSHYKLNDPKNKREELTNPKGENFQTRLFYPNGNLMEFYDKKAGIKINYNENGEVINIEKRKGVKIKKK